MGGSLWGRDRERVRERDSERRGKVEEKEREG